MTLAHDLCMNIWRFTYYINKPSLVQIGLQLFKWGHFHIFSLSYNLTSDDLWPWYLTFDLSNKWGFPCCIYEPTLVEIHQSMWKIEPNVNPFHNRQQQQGTKWSLCVFPAKAGDTKMIIKRQKKKKKKKNYAHEIPFEYVTAIYWKSDPIIE